MDFSDLFQNLPFLLIQKRQKLAVEPVEFRFDFVDAVCLVCHFFRRIAVDFGDLLRISPEFAGRLMGNTSTLYAFLKKRPESVELIAGVAGTRPMIEETQQVNRTFFVDWPTGMKSRKTVEGFVIHPNVVKRGVAFA